MSKIIKAKYSQYVRQKNCKLGEFFKDVPHTLEFKTFYKKKPEIHLYFSQPIKTVPNT